MEHPHTFIRFPGGREKALSFTFDDGAPEDRLLVERMGALGLRGTFNVNSGWFGRVFPHCTHMSEAETVEVLRRDFVEIACHGALHVDPTRVDLPTLVWDVMRDRAALERLFGRPITGYAYPQGAYTPEVMAELEKLGFEYARAVGTKGSFRVPQNLFELTATCHLLSDACDECTKKFLDFRCGDDLWWDSADALFFNIFCHSYQLRGSEERQQAACRRLEALAGREDVWYATNIELVRYVKAYRSLIFSLERGWVYNPSCQTVWLRTKEGVASVAPGGTARL